MGFLGYLIYCAVIVPPFWWILPRAGLSPYWGLVAAIPPLGAPVLLWFLAFRRWPGDGAGPGREV